MPLVCEEDVKFVKHWIMCPATVKMRENIFVMNLKIAEMTIMLGEGKNAFNQ